MKKKILIALIIAAVLLLAAVFVSSRRTSTDPEVARSVEAPDSYVGEYEAFRDAPGEEGLEERLLIESDGSASWSAEYVNTRPPIVSVGTWKKDAEGNLELTIGGDNQREYDMTLVYRFQPTENGIFELEGKYELTRVE